MTEKSRRNILSLILCLLVFIYLSKFGKAAVLKTYIEVSLGGCKKIPVLCVLPEAEIINSEINRRFLRSLAPYQFPEMEIRMPREFRVVKEQINKAYYKRKKREDSGPVSYLLYKQPNFFVGLFPNVRKHGIENDYDFISRTMYSVPSGIGNLTDMFFVIMKAIFTPNLGDEENVKMVKFSLADKKGFITYNLTDSQNYFDCNVINNQGDFFKVYIKDRAAALDLDEVLTIISTLQTN